MIHNTNKNYEQTVADTSSSLQAATESDLSTSTRGPVQ